MVLVGSYDVPLIFILLVLVGIIFIILLESIIIIFLLMRQLRKQRETFKSIDRLTDVMSQVKKNELHQLDRIRKK